MATVSNVDVTIIREVANASVTVTYTVNWSAFDRLTNLEYAERVRFVGVDPGHDADIGPVGDDLLDIGLSFVVLISADGRAATSRTRSLTFPIADLEAAIAGYTGDEIRAIVTLTPWLPPAVDLASSLVSLAA